MSLAIRGNDLFFFTTNMPKIELVGLDTKIDTFCQIDIRDLAIVVVEKILFGTFTKFL